MIKVFGCLFVLAAVAHCPQHQQASSDACAVVRASLYEDGAFKLTQDEVDHLTRETKVKIASLKSWYKKHC